MVNDGWHDQVYSFSGDQELNSRLSKLINEFCHVFRAHADGNWKTVYKPEYAALLAGELKEKPLLIRKLKALKYPVVSNITYAAIELNKSSSEKTF